MTDDELRVAALTQAVSNACGQSGEDIIKEAKAFYDFLHGQPAAKAARPKAKRKK